MKFYFKAIIYIFILHFSISTGTAAPDLSLIRSVVKVVVLSETGKQSLGSGVIIDNNIVATNCHVTRAAKSAFLVKEDSHYNVIAQAALPELDVCLLKTQAIAQPTVTLADIANLHLGDKITMLGYPFALGIRMRMGAIIGLHDYHSAKIIEIDTGFMQGASGGGVFNKKNELVGLMTFMGKDQSKIHYYVIPASWLALGLKEQFKPLQAFSKRSFWEKGRFEHLRNPKVPLGFIK